MKEDEVNIIVHDHDPSLSEMICEYADDPGMIAYAKKWEQRESTWQVSAVLPMK